MGFSRACIYNWLAKYRGGGWHALRSGKQSGHSSKLTGRHTDWIYNTVRDKDPQQLRLPFVLCACSIVADVIKKKFGLKLSLSSDYHAGRTWALKGQTLVVESTGARFSVNMFGAIDIRGRMRFMTTKGTVDSGKVCDFLKKLMHDNEGTVFLV